MNAPPVSFRSAAPIAFQVYKMKARMKTIQQNTREEPARAPVGSRAVAKKYDLIA